MEEIAKITVIKNENLSRQYLLRGTEIVQDDMNKIKNY